MAGAGIGARTKQAYEQAGAELLTLFNASGVAYTSRAAVLSVIEPEVQQCARHNERRYELPVHRLRERRIINITCELVHQQARSKGEVK